MAMKYTQIQQLENNIWDSLFAMSRSYDNVETQACSFRLLILSISYMLSVIANKYNFEKYKYRFRDTILFFKYQNCMCDDDFKDKCPTTDELFPFMKKYYNHCMSLEGSNIIQYDEFDKKYNLDKLTKSWWGPKLWYVIHTLAAFYDDSNSYFIAYKCFIMCLVHTLPCKICRVHFLKHITKESNDINKYSKDKQSLLYWSFIIHNSANAALGKPQFTFENASKLYLHQ